MTTNTQANTQAYAAKQFHDSIRKFNQAVTFTQPKYDNKYRRELNDLVDILYEFVHGDDSCHTARHKACNIARRTNLTNCYEVAYKIQTCLRNTQNMRSYPRNTEIENIMLSFLNQPVVGSETDYEQTVRRTYENAIIDIVRNIYTHE